MSLEVDQLAMRQAVGAANAMLDDRHDTSVVARALVVLAALLPSGVDDSLTLAETMVQCADALLKEQRATRH